jgi:hypothetical protein
LATRNDGTLARGTGRGHPGRRDDRRGRRPGRPTRLPVIKDANIPTTCVTGAVTGGTGDVIAVLIKDDLVLYEGVVRLRALPEIVSGTLQMRIQLYCYSAFIPNRFAPSTSIITGTSGLAAPGF